MEKLLLISYELRNLRINFSVFLLVLTAAFVMSTTFALLVGTMQIPLPQVLERGAPASDVHTSALAKDRFLQLIQSESDRELAGQVHFLTDLIRTTRKRTPDPKALALSIVRLSKELHYDPIFVTAVIKSESAFRRRARSHVGALGLMQIMPATGRHIARTEGYSWRGSSRLTTDPDYNILFGITYLKQLEQMFDKNMTHVLYAYNWGPGNVRRMRAGKARPPKVSRGYAKTILADHKKWTALYQSRQDQYKYMNTSYLR